MGNIVLLDEHTVNKIAAGEVVDRPASIVKELIENSIDAGATSVIVEIKNGGIKYIKVQDNGIGFKSDDVELAFERHATSKIRKEEDLSKITSMGFRGEALASIAAIAKVTLTTKNIDEDIGVRAYVEAGQIKLVEPSAAIKGSKIEISDIFYNVPARFKFLKKDSTEAGYIEDVVIRIAMSNPSISFKYINNGKTIVHTQGTGSLNDTIYEIFGKEIYDNLIPIEYEYDNIKVNGVIGLPVISRSTRMHQFTYVNSRYIKDKVVNSAIDRACSEKYAINKFPFCMLNIMLSPSRIDVNVHPAKLEVKFDNENQIFEAIYHAVRSGIENKNREMSPFSNIKEEEIKKDIKEISRDLENTGVLNNTEYKPKVFEFKLEEQVKQTVIEEPIIEQYNTNIIENIDEVLNIEVADDITPSVESVENIQSEIFEVLKEKEPVVYKYIGQVFETYIVIQIKDIMYIIDQHAAHERLLFEQFKESYYSTDRSIQMLLIPSLVQLTAKEMDIVIDNKDMFEKTGFIIEEFGENTVKISGVPNIGYDIEYNDMFKDIIDELLGASKTDKSEKEHRFLATLACKAAVKGNMNISKEEQISLIDKMVKLENPFTCPHGRPTAYEISKYDIERRFLRK